MTCQDPKPLEVASLICSRDVAMASRCLGSFVHHSIDSLRFVFHDDGSLTAANRDQLLSSFPEGRIVQRNEADGRIEPILAHYPNCMGFRRENVFGLKLFDTMLIADEPILNYYDGDILFFRPFGGLFALPEQADCIFMKDALDNCALRSWEMARHGVRFVSRANAGMLCVRRAVFDLDRLEWFLALPRRPLFKHFVEQSAWALLGAKSRAMHWDASQVRIMVPTSDLPPELVAGHYVATHRADLAAAKEFAADRAPAVTIRFQPASVTRAHDLFVDELSRFARRKLPGLRPQKLNPYS